MEDARHPAHIFLTSGLFFALHLYATFPGRSRGLSLRYLFEDYVLDTERRELHRGPNVLSVAPQVFDLLEYLIRNRERVVSKDELVSAIWNGRIVSDAAITTRLNVVRAVVGDT